MPPPQHLLASKLRGFVCRSCLSKLQPPQRQRIQWISRSFTTDAVHSRHKGATHLETGSTSLEETHDEAELEPEFSEESIIAALEEEVRMRRTDAAEYGPGTPGGVPKASVRYFEETPDGTREEVGDGLDDENMLGTLEKQIEDLKSDTGGLMEKLVGGDLSQPGKSPLADELRAQITEMERLDLENLSERDRLRIRKMVLKGSDSASSSTIESPPKLQVATSTYQTSSHSEPPVDNVAIADDIEIPVNEFPVAQQARIQQLVDALKRPSPAGRKKRGTRSIVNMNLSAEKSQLLRVWKAYSLCRNALIGLHDKVPKRTWMTLWNIFQVEGTHNLDRWARLKTLGDDICQAGFKLEREQGLLHIEATFIEGNQDHAIDMWRHALGPRRMQYWELGARMLAQNGQPQEALLAAESCLQCGNESESYRVLLPIIRAFLGLNTKSSMKSAWALYIRLRVSYSQYMTMEEYDVVVSSFLVANQPDLALGVFKDMMLTGQPSTHVEDSTAQYRAATGTKDDLATLKITIHELDWQSPRALSKLPSRWNNKYFFGKWLKKLIGDGELEAAFKVLDLMGNRHIQPSAIHLNGLIGAWFREGSEKSRGLAEDMAWRMIKARNDFVQRRNQLDPKLRFIDSTDLPSSRILAPTPPATIETFCVLLSQYRRRQSGGRMVDLFQAFRQSRIPPNTQFMNELLLTNKRGHKQISALDKQMSALETYRTVSEEQGIAPNFDTYKVLWGFLKTEVNPVKGYMHRPEKRVRHERCRKLFADMITKLPESSTETLPQDLYRLIIQTFSFAQDLSGTAVALRALQRRFGAYPDPESARIIVLQLARLGLKNEFGRDPRRLDTDSSITRERIATVTSILQQFKDQRIEALAQQGIKFSELKGDALKEEPLVLLLDLLRFADGQTNQKIIQEGYPTSAEKSKMAAEMMGVPDCQAWEGHGEIL